MPDSRFKTFYNGWKYDSLTGLAAVMDQARAGNQIRSLEIYRWVRLM